MNWMWRDNSKTFGQGSWKDKAPSKEELIGGKLVIRSGMLALKWPSGIL